MNSTPRDLPDGDREEALSWRPLRFLTLYRLTLAGLLTAIFFMLPANRALGGQAPWLFGSVSLAYLGFALVAGFAARLRRPRYGIQAFVQILVDILAIVLLMHAGGGLESGLGILLILAVAVGGLLLPGRLAYFFAAVATLAILSEFSLSMLTGHGGSGEDFTRVGLLGAGLFTTAVIAHLLAQRIRETEALAEQRGVDLANLARLNQHVIQRLQSGILVVDEQERVHLMNDTARVMLQTPHERTGAPLRHMSPELSEQLRRWRADPGRAPEIFTPAASQVSLAPRFTALGRTHASATLIFLEDTAALAQQAQQMKLAALGRLTASIAHEIRNPLGALSHAGQLLAESPRLDAGEQRLTEIIRNNSQRMNHIIEDVLQLSRRGQTQPKELVLNDWLRDFIDELVRCGRLVPGQLSLDTSVDAAAVHISFDPGHLHQITWNLVHNALTHGGGRVELRLGGTAAGQPCLDVLDRGPGIAAETEAQIFEPFFTTAASGTGLGLYLARELCELNRARLGYEPRAGGGSRFRITFLQPGPSL
ncbi:ATP-binding protein [Oceanibaculum nanhaiense]|uniref:sensor histidine kinase n=1 Tax=Oceanibaculum nanhaiense TaxID=1909734 RepID=UPI00396DA210